MTDRYDDLRAALDAMKATSSMIEATHWMAVIMRESEALLSERDSLRAALKPFSDLAAYYHLGGPLRVKTGTIMGVSDHRLGEFEITVEDLYAAEEARAALTTKEG